MVLLSSICFEKSTTYLGCSWILIEQRYRCLYKTLALLYIQVSSHYHSVCPLTSSWGWKIGAGGWLFSFKESQPPYTWRNSGLRIKLWYILKTLSNPTIFTVACVAHIYKECVWRDFFKRLATVHASVFVLYVILFKKDIYRFWVYCHERQQQAKAPQEALQIIIMSHLFPKLPKGNCCFCAIQSENDHTATIYSYKMIPHKS